jgi:hypothetical protein
VHNADSVPVEKKFPCSVENFYNLNWRTWFDVLDLNLTLVDGPHCQPRTKNIKIPAQGTQFELNMISKKLHKRKPKGSHLLFCD